MEHYEKYLARIEAGDGGSEVLEELHQEAARSIKEDPPERVLTLTGQMVGAMLAVTRKKNPPQQSMVDAINVLTAMLADYVEHLGWRQWAVKTETGWVYERSPSGC